MGLCPRGPGGSQRLRSGSGRETQPSVALEDSLGLHLFCREVVRPEKGRSHRTSEGLKNGQGELVCHCSRKRGLGAGHTSWGAALIPVGLLMGARQRGLTRQRPQREPGLSSFLAGGRVSRLVRQFWPAPGPGAGESPDTEFY